MTSLKIQVPSHNHLVRKFTTNGGLHGFSGVSPENLQKLRSRKIFLLGNWAEKAALHAIC